MSIQVTLRLIHLSTSTTTTTLTQRLTLILQITFVLVNSTPIALHLLQLMHLLSFEETKRQRERKRVDETQNHQMQSDTPQILLLL